MSKNPYSIPPMEGGGGSGAGVSGLSTADGGTAITDNVVVRGDGTTGIQGSAATLTDSGALTVGQGAVSAPALALGDGDTGFYEASATDDWLGIAVGGANKVTIFPSSFDFNVNVNCAANYVQSLRRLVEAHTEGSGAPHAIAGADSFNIMTNEGSTAANYHTLVTAAAGWDITFIVQDADGLRITANTDDTIRVLDKVTATAGYIESTTIGSVVRLVAINATEWIATSIHGTWTDGTFTYDDTGNTTP